MDFTKVNLLEISDFVGGSQPPKSDFVDSPRENYIRLLQIRDFESDEKAIYIPNNKDLKKVIKKDILLGRYGASVGKILTGKEGTYNVALMKVKPNKQKIHNRFLFYVLKSLQFQKYIKLISESRAAQAGFSKKDLSRFYFYLPDLYTQEKIYLQLDTIQVLIHNRIESIEMLDKLIESIYFDMFGEPVNNQKNYPLKKLSELTPKDKIITYGIVQAGPHIEDGVPYIRSGDIKNGNIKINQLLKTSNKISNSYSRTICKEGDVIITIRATVGEVAKITNDYVGYNLTRGIAVITPNEKVLLTDYLFSTLLTRGFKYLIERKVKGSTFKEITLQKLREIKIPIPSIELQKEFSSLKHLIDLQKESLEKSLDILQNLFQAVLQNAFNPNTEIDEQPIFKDLIKRLSTEDLKGNKKRLQYLLELFEENKFNNAEDYIEAKDKLFDLIIAGEIEQKVKEVHKNEKITLEVK